MSAQSVPPAGPNISPRAAFRKKEFTPARRDGRIINAMSVDVEDYFQVQAFTETIDRDDWQNRESRVERNTDRILEIFSDAGIKATFFTLGWIAERHPGLIRRIVDGGHELASHGYAHYRVFEQQPEQFRDDIRQAKQILEDLSGEQVRGYRAATFSINQRNLWAFDILAEEGYAYSSSIYPVHHDIYGMPSAPRFPFYPSPTSMIEEYPITTLEIGGRTLPSGGGGYFRLLPYVVSKWAIGRTNRRDAQPCMFYFHPWEVDPDQPRIAGISAKSRFRHYLNLRRMEGRLRRLVRDFSWDRMDRVFLETSTN